MDVPKISHQENVEAVENIPQKRIFCTERRGLAAYSEAVSR